jgi:hypothetical protein
MAKAARRPAPTLEPWCPIRAPDGRAYVIGRRLISMSSRLASGRRGFGELRRWMVVGPVLLSNWPKVSVIGCDDGTIYRLGDPISYEALDPKVLAALALDLAIVGIDDTDVPLELIQASLFSEAAFDHRTVSL